jgi:hypothetical protein
VFYLTFRALLLKVLLVVLEKQITYPPCPLAAVAVLVN